MSAGHPLCDLGREPPMSESSQKAKNSRRAYVFRFAPNTRRCAMQSTLHICAMNGSDAYPALS